MLLGQGFSQFLWSFDNWGGNPTNSPGTSVIPGASNAEGSWTQLATAGNIANDVYWVQVNVSNGSATGVSKPHLLDIGVDPAGGTSYTEVVSNIVCGGSPNATSVTHQFLFPMFIPAGSTIAARVQGGAATANTIRVAAKFYGQPSRPEAARTAHFSETIGAITGSNGVSFTPGNVVDGSWVSLGTTAKPMWWWQLGHQIDNATQSNHLTYIDLAFGDTTNKHIIQRTMISVSSAEAYGHSLPGNLMWTNCFCPLPAGAELFVRGRNNAAPVTGYNAVAIGFGG